jgi:uncharacterized membrane protein YtjA (UPF0391 family)
VAGQPIASLFAEEQTGIIAAATPATLDNPGGQLPVKPGALAMLHYAVVFFVIALIAAVFGFGGIAASAVGIGKILFIVFAILAVASFLFGLIKKS